MEYQDIAAVGGKPGLFKVVKPTRTGVILETLDAKKTKLIINANSKVSILDEISIYTTSKEDTVPLKTVLAKIFSEFGDDPGIEAGADPAELRAFLKHILPDFDEGRVYPSDIKKMISWYTILLKEAPELLKPEAKPKKTKAEKEPQENKPKKEQVAPQDKPFKPAKSKKPAQVKNPNKVYRAKKG